jgi:integrase
VDLNQHKVVQLDDRKQIPRNRQKVTKMASIYKRKTRTGKSKKWYIDYFDEHGQRRTKVGYSDKALTERYAVKIEKRIERIKAGEPVIEEETANLPIKELKDQCIQDLMARGRSIAHVNNTNFFLTKFIEGCKIEKLREIKASIVNNFLATKKSPRTKNAYRNAIYAFCEYAVKRNWLSSNPIKNVTKHQETKVRPRRAFTTEEFRLLNNWLNTKNNGQCKRQIIYKVAAFSGLRRREIKELQIRDVDLSNPERPVFRLRAEAQKGKRAEVIPIFPECAEIFKEVIKKRQAEGCGAMGKIFRKFPVMDTLNTDMKAAGIKKIDEQNRSLDFHSFRYFFCTQIARKLPIQKVRILMRHKSIQETCNIYLQLGLVDLGEEVWKLGSFWN